MAEPYLQELEALLARHAAALRNGANIDARHFFSGAAAYTEERMFVSLTPAGLALKLSEADRATLSERGGKPLKYFPKAPVKKDYLVLPDAIAGDDAALAGWIKKSVAYVLTLPKPRPKSGGRK